VRSINGVWRIRGKRATMFKSALPMKRRKRRMIGPHTHGWNFDSTRQPGPKRDHWEIGHPGDLIVPSPDGQFACVVHSCGQVNYVWTIGLLAMFKGPRERPTLILGPENITCSNECGHIQWLDGSRYCVVTTVIYNGVVNRIELMALTFLNVMEERYAHYEPKNILKVIGSPIISADGHWVIRGIGLGNRHSGGLRIDPKKLKWRPWHALAGLSES
jgi:hypothetical protein